MSPASSDADDELGPILSESTSVENRPSPVVSHSDDDDDVPLSFKMRASTSVKNRPSAASPVVSRSDDDDDDDVALSFKMRASTSVKNRPSAASPVVSHSDDDDVPLAFKRATTSVKNKPLAASPVVFHSEDDYPLSFRRASTSAKNRPTVSKRKIGIPIVRKSLLQNHQDEQINTEDGEGGEKTQKIEDHAKPGDGGRPKKNRKVTASEASIEDNMLAFIDRKRQQASMEQKASHQGQQYSISRCLEVLHGIEDVSDEIKVLASDVLKDAASREFFLCYESRLRGLWLKKEVAKLGTQLPPW